MTEVLFIVWRESLEAILVVGILYAYLVRMQAGRRGSRYLAAGVAGGIALSALLAAATLSVASELQGAALSYFQAGMMFAAALLLTQMVIWMSRQGPRLKRNLENNLQRALGAGSLIGVAVVSLLAVAREGAETVLYLYGLGFQAHGAGYAAPVEAACAGFALALLTAWLVSRGVHFLSYRIFFRITGVILLFTAAGMLTSAMEKLIGMGAVPSLLAPVWNTSAVLDSSSGIGGLIGTLTGYRARPSLMLVLVYAAYWAAVLGWFALTGRHERHSAATTAPSRPARASPH